MAKVSNRHATTLPLLLLLFHAQALLAQDDDPFALEGVEAEAVEEQPVIEDQVSLGLYWLDSDALQFGKYTGLTEEGAYLLLDFRIDRRPDWDSGDITRWSLEGTRLGLDSRRVEYDYHEQGKQRFTATYAEIPNYRFADGRTPYINTGPGLFELPADWGVEPGSSNTRGFTNLYDNLFDLEVDTQRKNLRAEYKRVLGRSWRMTIDYRHEIKEGSRTLGAIFGTNGGNPRGVILPAPVDYTYDIIEVLFDFTGSRVQGGVGAYLSFFGNDQTSMTWQNAFGQLNRWADGVAYPDAYGRMALEPDNQYVQVRGWLGFDLTPGSRLTADVSIGRSEQDDPLLPYTVNPNLVVNIPVPLTVLNGKIDTSYANLRYTGQLARRLSLTANYRYDDRDNGTPRAPYPYIGGDAEDQKDFEDARINLPYSYTKHEAELAARWRIASASRLKFGVEYEDISRTYMEVSDSDEWTGFVGYRFNGWEVTGFSVDWRRSEREVDDYVGNRPLILSHLPGQIEEDEWENHPLLRKYFQTSRDRDELRGRVDVYPNDTLNFGVSAIYWEDDYEAGFFGLNNAKASSLSLDFGWYPAENLVLTAYYTVESYKAEQSSRSFRNAAGAADPDNNWFAETDDDVNTWNVALNWKGIGEERGWRNVTAGFDYTVSDVESQITVTNVSNSTEPLPPLVTDMSSVSAWVDIGVSARSSINLMVQWNELDMRDFGLDGVVPDTLANVLTLGESAGSYDVLMLWGAWTARF